MIKIAISVNKCDSGGQKSLIMTYLRNFDPKRIYFDLIVDKDSNSIPFDEVNELGGGIYVIPPYQHILAHLNALRKLLREKHYDALYALNNTMNLFPLGIAYFNGIKVRVSESLTMASPLEKKKTMMKNVLKRFSHLFCNYYMANGKDCGIYQFGKKAYEDGTINIFLTPVDAKKYTFDPILREDTRQKFGWGNMVVYGYIARFEKQKNPLFLVDIMNEIAQKQDNAHFVIIGAGSMEQQIKNKIAKYGLDEKMSWLGRREDIKQFYNAFDAFLLPSLYEGLPVVGIESQSTGLPVFFSEEITREAGIAELGHFISLKKSAAEWANIIISETRKAMPLRRGREKDLMNAGFDAVSEAERLTVFFERAVEEQNKRFKSNNNVFLF
ncbi:MAG: glycosyltransferase [Prevotella sp.]|jgi:glycosyltransferase involved in cell wall biosynthesis|nr:glycosyltransferase [Prevotella sp.]